MYCNDACWHAEVLVWRGPAGKAGDATIVLGALQLNDTECPKVSALLRARCAVMDFPFGTCPKCVVTCCANEMVQYLSKTAETQVCCGSQPCKVQEKICRTWPKDAEGLLLIWCVVMTQLGILMVKPGAAQHQTCNQTTTSFENSVAASSVPSFKH